MPEGPAVAGFEPLCDGANAVDRADCSAERDGAVGAHQCSRTALGVDETRARRDETALDQRRERDARSLACGHEGRQAVGWQRLDRCDALARCGCIAGVTFEADETAA